MCPPVHRSILRLISPNFLVGHYLLNERSDSVHRDNLQFYDAVSRGSSGVGNAPLNTAHFYAQALTNFLPESVRKTPSFTDDFSGLGLIYELKMTPKFRVKKISEKFV